MLEIRRNTAYLLMLGALAFNVIPAFTELLTVKDTIFVTCTAMLMWCLAMLSIMMASEKKWMVRLAGKVLAKVPVELVDHEGKRVYTLATKQADGQMVAPVYWFTSVGECLLQSNGRVDPDSESSYIYFWLPLGSSEERMLHVMVNDLPDFAQLADLGPVKRREIMRRLSRDDQP